MAIYPYLCEKCDVESDVIKSMHDSAREEQCKSCGNRLKRIYTPSQIIGASVQNAEFNLGLGCVTKNKRHREEIASRRGLVEVGNETPQTLHRESVVKRAKEREKEWDEL